LYSLNKIVIILTKRRKFLVKFPPTYKNMKEEEERLFF